MIILNFTNYDVVIGKYKPSITKKIRIACQAIFVKLNKKQGAFKLCKVEKKAIGPNKVCYLVTHDGRTLRFSDPDIEINDTIQLNVGTGEIMAFYKMGVNNVVYVSNFSFTYLF